MSALTWELGVCTYNRPDAITECVRMALRQTHLPSAITIVDASQAWQQTRDTIKICCQENGYTGCFSYVPANKKGLTSQRNQVAALATADVVFMIDDDSMMFPDCAEQIMNIYEADTEQTIYGIQAVDAERHPEAPEVCCDADEIDVSVDQGEKNVKPSSMTHRLAQWAYRHCSLFRTEGTFIPFRGGFPDHEVPSALVHFGCYATRHLEGYRMTYRLNALRAEPFTEMLPTQGGEDLEYSYRVSWHGGLVTAPKAKLFHDQSPLERDSHYFKAFCRAVNPMVLCAVYGRDRKWCKKECNKLIYRRLLSEGIKDIASRRFSMPRFRGIWAGARYRRKIFQMPVQDLDAWYPQIRDRHRASA